jgi:hypothetical protein
VKRISFDTFRAVSHFGNMARHAIIAKYKTSALAPNYLAFALLVRERNYPAIPDGWTVSKVKSALRQRIDDCPADNFCHLRHYGVSEASKSVHPIGNPMSHSTNSGLRRPPSGEGCGYFFVFVSPRSTAWSRQSLAGVFQHGPL